MSKDALLWIGICLVCLVAFAPFLIHLYTRTYSYTRPPIKVSFKVTITPFPEMLEIVNEGTIKATNVVVKIYKYESLIASFALGTLERNQIEEIELYPDVPFKRDGIRIEVHCSELESPAIFEF